MKLWILLAALAFALSSCRNDEGIVFDNNNGTAVGNVWNVENVDEPDEAPDLIVDPKCLPYPFNEELRVKAINGNQVTLKNDESGAEFIVNRQCVLNNT